MLSARAPANRTWPHLWFFAEKHQHRAERDRGIGERNRQRETTPNHSAHEPRRMQDAAVDRMSGDVLHAGNVEAAVHVWKNLHMDVAVGAADVDVRAGVVGDERRILTAPHPGEIFRWLETRRVARAEQRHDRNREHHPHNTLRWIHTALKSSTTWRELNERLTSPLIVLSASTLLMITRPIDADSDELGPAMYVAPAVPP